YNSIPTGNGASADVVVGQPDMVTNFAQLAANRFTYPDSVVTDGTKIYITDSSNNRVLIYNSIPAGNGASANVVVGQTDMTSGGSGITAAGLNGPNGVYSDGSKLYVADS